MGRMRFNESPPAALCRAGTPMVGGSEGGVAVLPPTYAVRLHRVVDGPRDRPTRARRVDDLVDHADLLCLVHPAGQPLVLCGELGLDLGPDLGRDLRELA